MPQCDIPIQWCSNGSNHILCINGPHAGESDEDFAKRAGKELTADLKAHPKTSDC
jgi:hypothetical protein